MGDEAMAQEQGVARLERMFEMSWTKRIKKALKTGRFTEDDVQRAGHWTQCAVGEAIERKPAVVFCDFVGPEDDRLTVLGVGFLRAVEKHEVKKAARIYARIQQRTVEMALGL